jgi:hypothetical protein
VGEGRVLAAAFGVLEPIGLDTIKGKVAAAEYAAMADFKNDVTLALTNAAAASEPASQVRQYWSWRV